MIIALAGRRIDPADATQQRFPVQNVGAVEARVRAKLENLGASTLVCSAACGADLVALSAGASLGLRQRVVLPFDRRRFEETSVTDRPGDWRGLYERILDQVEAAGNLVIVPAASDRDAYSATNRRILDEAMSLGHQFHEPVTAMLIWDGASRGANDLTAGFCLEARNRGLPVIEVRTDRYELTEK
jgi:hypothetical protein